MSSYANGWGGALMWGKLRQLCLAACLWVLTACVSGGEGKPFDAVRTPTLETLLGAEVDRFVKADEASPPAFCRVLFVGSSSIVNWRTLAQDMAPLPVINRGFGGAHIEHVNRWFDQIVARYRPSSIVFYAGENDLAAGKPVESVVADFDAFMARKTEALDTSPVYFVSLKPSRLRFGQLALQTQVNDAIRARATRREDLHYIDVASSMLQDGKPRDLFISDDLHMKPEGYSLWTGLVRAALFPYADVEARNCRRIKKI